MAASNPAEILTRTEPETSDSPPFLHIQWTNYSNAPVLWLALGHLLFIFTLR